MSYYVETTNLDWCPTFTYCEQCHEGKGRDAQGRKTTYVKAHCKNDGVRNGLPYTCTKVEKGLCQTCKKTNLTWEDLI